MVNYRKNTNPDELKINFDCDTVNINFGPDSRIFQLYSTIIPGESHHTLTKFKIELHLKKKDYSKWATLEKAAEKVLDTKHYPTSSKKQIDWDKLEKEAEKLDDDKDPLQKLFGDIYKDASEDTRRAMVKSFVESQGTVLSTNWDEVGKGHVDMKPPDGTEFKKYDV